MFQKQQSHVAFTKGWIKRKEKLQEIQCFIKMTGLCLLDLGSRRAIQERHWRVSSQWTAFKVKGQHAFATSTSRRSTLHTYLER